MLPPLEPPPLGPLCAMPAHGRRLRRRPMIGPRICLLRCSEQGALDPLRHVAHLALS